MSTLVPLSSNSRGQVSSLPAGVTSWPPASDEGADCAHSGAQYVRAATSAGIKNRLNRARVFAAKWTEDLCNSTAVQGNLTRGAVGLPARRRRCLRRSPTALVCSRNQRPQPRRRNKPTLNRNRGLSEFPILCLINLFQM